VKIDNSRANLFRKCPDAFKERYINGLEKDWGGAASPFAFGSRVHQLLEEHLLFLKGTPHEPLYPPSQVEAVELEAAAMFASYCAHYPLEPFDVISVEQVFAVAIPGTEHIYTGKFDAIIRYKDNGLLAILEHKTEKRSALKNLPEAWAARSQVSLYMWAAEILYNERPTHILLDVLRRCSEKGQEPATFYRDILERTPEQCEQAIQDLVYVADSIEDLERHYDTERWPQNTDNCCIGRWKCDYFSKHVGGSDLEFKPAEEYLGSL
jgi:hypothetical protein